MNSYELWHINQPAPTIALWPTMHVSTFSPPAATADEPLRYPKKPREPNSCEMRMNVNTYELGEGSRLPNLLPTKGEKRVWWIVPASLYLHTHAQHLPQLSVLLPLHLERLAQHLYAAPVSMCAL